MLPRSWLASKEGGIICLKKEKGFGKDLGTRPWMQRRKVVLLKCLGGTGEAGGLKGENGSKGRRLASSRPSAPENQSTAQPLFRHLLVPPTNISRVWLETRDEDVTISQRRTVETPTNWHAKKHYQTTQRILLKIVPLKRASVVGVIA